MPAPVSERLSALLAEAADTDRAKPLRWQALEDAHVLSQPWALPHVRVHLHMLRVAVADRDRREALGQAVRLVLAGPGSVSGRYPPGNSGRANVSATLPMAVRPELAALLPEELRPAVIEASGSEASKG